MQKPSSCDSCSLATLGRGFVPPSGPARSPVLFLGESPGEREIQVDEPFAGPAGGKFNHILYRLSRVRTDQRVHNLISCRPPYDKLDKAPWEYDALSNCRVHLNKVLNEPKHQVIVTLGAVPTRQILQVSGNLKDFHGTVSPCLMPDGRNVWVVPTFHPSHLIRGAHNLTGTMIYDISRAFEIAESGWEPDKPIFFLDPPPAQFRAWAQEYLEAVAQDPENVWLSVDIETADTERKLDEGELKASDRSMEIQRINFSYRLDEGLTVPFVGPYIPIIKAMLETLGPKWFWNKNYDLRRLWSFFGVEALKGPLLDGMDAWHALHSDVPKGLGFVAPYYSKWGPWKHMAHSEPVAYAAGDALQNQRCCFGVAADLQSQGMWDVFWRHMHEVDRLATSPSCRVGLAVDAERVEGMRVELREKTIGFFNEMQSLVPDSVKPLHPKGGWTRRPAGETFPYPQGAFNSRERPILEILQQRVPTQQCMTCQAIGVNAKHRCKGPDGKIDKAARANVVKLELQLPRYFVQDDFNPGSPQQVMAYIKVCGHKPGREKGKETTNRETLERLAEGKPKNSRDEAAREVYRIIMDFKEVKKVLGNYVEGTLRRLAESEDGRLHPVVTNNPSTLRTAYNSPNLQNVVADKRGKKSLAAGFRKCIIAQEERQEERGQAG